MFLIIFSFSLGKGEMISESKEERNERFSEFSIFGENAFLTLVKETLVFCSKVHCKPDEPEKDVPNVSRQISTFSEKKNIPNIIKGEQI